MNPKLNLSSVAFVVASVFLFGCATEFQKRQKCANNGDSLAQYEMGMLYGTGTNGVFEGDEVVSCDLRAAKEWFEKSSRGGNGNAKLALGLCYYYNGILDKSAPEGMTLGIVKDVTNYKKAFELFECAASNGVEEACLWLGECKLLGRGTKQNASEAISWFMNGVRDDGHPLCVASACASRLGDCHLYGLGVGTARDLEKCKRWYTFAKEHGDVRAARILKSKILTPSEFAKFNCAAFAEDSDIIDYRLDHAEEVPGEPDSRKLFFIPKKGSNIAKVHGLIYAQLTDDFKNEFRTGRSGMSRDDVVIDIQILKQTEQEMNYKVTKKYIKVIENECKDPTRLYNDEGVFTYEKPENFPEDIASAFIDKQLKSVLKRMYPEMKCSYQYKTDPNVVKTANGYKISFSYRVIFE